MNLGCIHPEAVACKTLVGMAFAYIYYIAFRIRREDEQRILVAADRKTFSLADSVELRPLVPSCDSAPRVGFKPCFEGVVTTAALVLLFKTNG